VNRSGGLSDAGMRIVQCVNRSLRRSEKYVGGETARLPDRDYDLPIFVADQGGEERRPAIGRQVSSIGRGQRRDPGAHIL